MNITPPKPSDMPPWWPPDRPPERLREDRIYRGSDGRWYHSDGRIVNREQRRRAGAR